jgi:hypothetical protein
VRQLIRARELGLNRYRHCRDGMVLVGHGVADPDHRLLILDKVRRENLPSVGDSAGIRGRTRSDRFRPGPYGVGVVPADQAKVALNETTRAFGEQVRDRRAELGLSPEAAAVRCGIHWTQLGKVERGQRSLRLETIMKIAAGLDIDAGVLVTGLPAPSDETDT